MIKIKDLYVSSDKREILKGLNLEIKPGEIHAIMGPNGSGKSTLVKVIAGHPQYSVSGKIKFKSNFKDKDLLSLTAEERSLEGIFLAFQYPVELSVSNFTFLKAIFDAHCKKRGTPLLDVFDFEDLVKAKLLLLEIDESFLHRSVNQDFSGGEKKRNEILQMLLLQPKLILLDEIDSGLDVDSLKVVTNAIKAMKESSDAAFVIVTHYNRILKYIEPDFVHIMEDGKIVRTSDSSLALAIEEKGYR